MERAFGALPPPGREWEVGKTAASICFVHDAEAILAESKLSSETAQRVRDRVERVRAGDEVITEFMNANQIVLGAI